MFYVLLPVIYLLLSSQMKIIWSCDR